MADRVIDYDRGHGEPGPKGVVIRLIDNLNMEVFMYKNEPGVYYSAHGKELPKAIAARAGYDVEALELKRLHRQRVAQASETIASELQLKGDGRKRVIEEAGGFRIVVFGPGRHEVEDADGQSLTPGAALTLDLARTVFNDLVAKARVEESPLSGTPRRPGVAGAASGAAKVAP